MEYERYIKQLDKISAPPDFERSVLERLRKKKRQRLWLLRLEWGVAVTVLVLLIVQLAIQPFFRWNYLMTDMASVGQVGQREIQDSFITEAVDLKREIKTAYEEPQAIFILEQVSDNWVQQIKY